MTDSRWVSIPQPNPGAKGRLFCLPNVGASAVAFSAWGKRFYSHTEVCGIELPGRGSRLREAASTSLPQLVDALATALPPFLDRPFAIYGQGMGALIGFELARRLSQLAGAAPFRLIVADEAAPQVPKSAPFTYNLPEEEFISVVRNTHDIPMEVIEHPELIHILLPLLRADTQLVESYSYVPGPPLEIPISAYGWSNDPLSSRFNIEQWSTQTAGRFKSKNFVCNRFHSTSVQFALLNEVNADIFAFGRREEMDANSLPSTDIAR